MTGPHEMPRWLVWTLAITLVVVWAQMVREFGAAFLLWSTGAAP